MKRENILGNDFPELEIGKSEIGKIYKKKRVNILFVRNHIIDVKSVIFMIKSVNQSVMNVMKKDIFIKN